MKQLALLIIGLALIAAAAVLASCSESTDSLEPTTTETRTQTATATQTSTATATPAVSSCVSCHMDKKALQDTATEVVAAAPEEASGEG